MADAKAEFAPLRDAEDLRTNERILAHFQKQLEKAQREVDLARARISDLTGRIAMRQAA